MTGRTFKLLDLSSGCAPGRAITVAPGETREILDVRASDAEGAQLVTVQCSGQFPDAAARRVIFPDDLIPVPPGGLWWPTAYLRLRWGVHGATHELFCDLSGGWSATLCADFVRLSCVYERNEPARESSAYGVPDETAGPPLVVAASLAYGTRAGGSTSPRRTVFAGALPNGGGQTAKVAVPSWARGLCVLGLPAAGATSAIYWYGGASAVTPIQITPLDFAASSSEWNASIVPLGAQTARVVSTGPTSPLSLVWLLGV